MKPFTRLSLFLALISAAACLLTACGSKEKAPQVDVSAAASGLKSTVADERANACVELAKAGPGAAGSVPDLITVLKDPDPLVRHLAAYALGQIGPKAASAIPALKEALNDGDRQVVMDAVNALRFIGDTNSNINVPAVMTQ